MPESAPASREIRRYTLALHDFGTVASVAKLLTEHDPLINPLGVPPGAGIPEGARLSDAQRRALLQRATAIYRSLGELQLRLVVETGLIVTYARPFTGGDGFPIGVKHVPAEYRGFHRQLLDLRDKVQAHHDSPAVQVTMIESATGSRSVQSSGPGLLRQDELLALTDLAESIRDSLRLALDGAQSHE